MQRASQHFSCMFSISFLHCNQFYVFEKHGQCTVPGMEPRMHFSEHLPLTNATQDQSLD